MKNTFTQHLKKLSNQLMLAILFAAPIIHKAQNSYTFTPCGAVGAAGPTQTQANSTYTSGNSLNGSVTIVGSGIQQFTVPTTGVWKIEARGASGYPFGTGGRGAKIYGEFNLTAGNVLKIVVAQTGSYSTSGGNLQYGGGGGSFVALLNNTPLVVAGGGGGSHVTSYTTSTADGTVSTSGNTGAGSTSGTGGTAGGGGAASNSANGGAGFFGDGGGTTGVALSFTNGAIGGNLNGTAYVNGGIGGFGGGGGTQSWNNNRGGGGGGYSGGGGGQLGQPSCWGGGGGSFNSGSNQLNLSGANTASDGLVIITEMCNVKVTSSGSNSLAPVICAGTTLTLTTNAIGNYNWSNGNTTSSTIAVTPTVTTTYTVSGTGTINACQGSSAITVTVSSGVPTLAVSGSTNICLGKTATLSATGALTYTWSGGITNSVSFTPTTSTSYTVSGQNGCGTSTSVASITISPLVVTAISQPTINCSGYTSTLIASSTVNGYTWQPTGVNGANVLVSPAATTVFTVTASDGTCAGTATVLLTTQPIPTLNIVASATNVCQGSAVTLTASGAATYTWSSPTQTGAIFNPVVNAPTLFNVVGTNSLGCQSTTYIAVVTQPMPTVLANVNSNLICNGETVTLTASGATSYSWSTGSTNFSITSTPTISTTYFVSGTSNSCTATQTLFVGVFTPTLTVSSNTAVCLGGLVTLQANGANTYAWSNGTTGPNTVVTPTTLTVYSVSALSSTGSILCPSSASVQVAINPNPTISAVASRTSICKGENASVSVSGAQTYTWNTGEKTSSITVTSSLVTTNNYSVVGTNSLGCTNNATVSVKINACTGIDVSARAENNFVVFPNPSNGSFIISSNFKIKISIINQLGQIIKEDNIDDSNNYSLQVKDLKSGVYFVTGIDGQNTINKKIIVE